VQVDLDGEIADIQHVLANRVAKEDLADKGRETDPHITVRYGFPAEVTAANVKDAVAGIPWAYLQFRETRFFEGSPDYDVLYVAVASDELERMNEALAKLPHEDTHSTYTPHMTVAYLKKGMGAKYSGDRLAYGKATFADHLTFSDLRGNKTKIKLMSGY
jgi:2'-5' RNA ligase